MLYALLFYGSEDTAAEQRAPVTDHLHLGGDSYHKSIVLLEAQLLPTTTAVTLRCTPKTVVLDGPYAFTKDELLGFNVMEAPNLAQAIAFAEASVFGTPAVFACEIRPIFEFDAAR
jgi:hypothetical protein